MGSEIRQSSHLCFSGGMGGPHHRRI